MIVLAILLGLLLLLLLLLFIPLRIELHYHENEFSAALSYLWLRFALFPLPEKPEKKKKTKPTAEPAPEKEPKKPARQRPFMDYLQLFNDLLPILQQNLRHMLGHITLRQCRIGMVIAAEDAGDTAIRYGRANLLLYNIYAFLANHIRIREFRTDLRQDYLGGAQAEKAEADLLLSLCPITMLSSGFRLLWRGGKVYLDFKNQGSTSSTKGRQ